MADTGTAPKSAPADNVREIFVSTCGAIGATILERAMTGRINHIAVAVRDLDAATKVYLDTLGASVSEMVAQPDHGVTTIFVNLANAKIELIAPLGNASPIEKFLERNPEGGIHHVCYQVNNIVAAPSPSTRAPPSIPSPPGLLRHARRARAGVSGPVDRPVDSRRIEVRCRTRCEN